MYFLWNTVYTVNTWLSSNMRCNLKTISGNEGLLSGLSYQHCSIMAYLKHRLNVTCLNNHVYYLDYNLYYNSTRLILSILEFIRKNSHWNWIETMLQCKMLKIHSNFLYHSVFNNKFSTCCKFILKQYEMGPNSNRSLSQCHLQCRFTMFRSSHPESLFDQITHLLRV